VEFKRDEMPKVPGFGTIEVFVNKSNTITLQQDNGCEEDEDVVAFPPEYAERIIEAIRECVREIESDGE
jgi:hypothetical protein